jgi:hypothetical protein
MRNALRPELRLFGMVLQAPEEDPNLTALNLGKEWDDEQKEWVYPPDQEEVVLQTGAHKGRTQREARTHGWRKLKQYPSQQVMKCKTQSAADKKQLYISGLPQMMPVEDLTARFNELLSPMVQVSCTDSMRGCYECCLLHMHLFPAE